MGGHRRQFLNTNARPPISLSSSKGRLNIVKILPFHSLLSHGDSPEKNSPMFKNAGPVLKLLEGKAQALGRAERTEEYVSTA